MVCGVLILTMAVLSGQSAPALAEDAGFELHDGRLVPKRAPKGRDGASGDQLDSVGKQLASRLAGGERLQRTELVSWLRTDGNSLAKLLHASGVDAELLIEEAMNSVVPATGGPFIAVDAGNAIDPMDEAIDHVISSVPVAAPLDTFKINSKFGKRIDPRRRKWAFHRGIDLGAPRGTIVKASADGTVKKSGRMGGYGNIVILDHGNGVETVYAHLSRYDVRAGATVNAGERIGVIGRTGRATGVHLHYEVRVNDRALDPGRFMNVGVELASVIQD